MARRCFLDQPREVTGAPHVLAIELHDDIARFHAGLGRRTVLPNLIDHGAGTLGAGILVADRHTDFDVPAGPRQRLERRSVVVALTSPLTTIRFSIRF